MTPAEAVEVAVPVRGARPAALRAVADYPVDAADDAALAALAGRPVAPDLRRRVGAALARLPEAERVAIASARLERQAARDGRRDARGGRYPGPRPEYQRFARLYAAAFLAELRARWPVDVIERVVRRRPWLAQSAAGAKDLESCASVSDRAATEANLSHQPQEPESRST